jgi:hypothetical protein
MQGYPTHAQKLYIGSTLPLYHTRKVKGQLITKTDSVQQPTVTANAVQQHHGKFTLMGPTVWSQRFNRLYLVCMQFQPIVDNFLQG